MLIIIINDKLVVMKKLKKLLLVLAIILATLIVVIGSYVLYVVLQYSRIDDNISINVDNEVSQSILITDKQYTISTYNIGFGAYSPDYSFFMDTGVMKDGTPVRGKSGTGKSKEEVNYNTLGAIEEIKKLDSDFIILQEVDTDSTRSYQINQKQLFEEAFLDYCSTYTPNFHSSYSMLPINDPHGIANTGLLTFAKVNIDRAVRKNYPVSDAFPAKYFDLDRCFTVNYVKVENNKDLVIINSHMSAYDKGGLIRKKQLTLLNTFMEEEYNKGNYLIVGGDFNHALGSDIVEAFTSEQEIPSWVNVLDDSDLVPFMSICKAENRFEVATCRSSDIPYEKNVNYVSVIDGFLVSDNISATAINIETNFAYSDHQPVIMTFDLQ